MARQSKAEKLLEASLNASFKKVANGVPIPMLSLSKLFAHAKKLVLAGAAVDDAMADATFKELHGGYGPLLFSRKIACIENLR